MAVRAIPRNCWRRTKLCTKEYGGMKKYVFATLIFLLAAGGACVAQSDEPSLGELAKKHRQEEKGLAVKVKVLTNEDVATSTPSAQAATASTATAAPSAAAAAKSPDKASDTG